MMFGKNGTEWHEPGHPVRERYVKEYTIYQTGKRAGQPRPIYDWRIKYRKRKEITGYDGVFKRGKNKGRPKPVYETVLQPIPSTGFFPSVNHIYFNTKSGKRRLKPIAENHLYLWHTLTEQWQRQNQWVTLTDDTKVVVDLIYYLPKGEMDTHNTKKLLLDAIEGVIHVNDYYILDRTIDFTIDNENPRIDLHISIPSTLYPLST